MEKTMERSLYNLGEQEMAALLYGGNAAACVKNGSLEWIAMTDFDGRKKLVRDYDELHRAWELADAEGCGMVVWNRTAEKDLLPAKKDWVGKENALWVCSDPDDHQYLRQMNAEGTKFFFLQGQYCGDSRVQIYHGVIDLDDYSEEEINRVLATFGYSSKQDIAVTEQLSDGYVQQIVAECIWETELFEFPSYWISNTENAAAFLRWWTYPLVNTDVDMVKILRHDVCVARDNDTRRYFVVNPDGGYVFASNNGEYYATVEEAEKAWKEAQDDAK